MLLRPKNCQKNCISNAEMLLFSSTVKMMVMKFVYPNVSNVLASIVDCPRVLGDPSSLLFWILKSSPVPAALPRSGSQ